LPYRSQLGLRMSERDIRGHRRGHIRDLMIDFTRTNQGLSLLAGI
jgi:hypothetical protein